MTVSRLTKSQALSQLQKLNANASFGSIIRLGAISSNELNLVRKKFYEHGLVGIVVKNSLSKKALLDSAIISLNEEQIQQMSLTLTGRTILAFYSDKDAWKGAQTLNSILKDHPKLEVQFMLSADGIVGDHTVWKWYSNLPSLPEVHSSLINEIYKPLILLLSSIKEAFQLES